MLADPTFYINGNVDKPDISNYTIRIPPGVPRQDNGYDCGVWVCSWMIDPPEKDKDYDIRV